MIQIQGISLSFGTQKIFDNISHIINSTDRIGLVGLNGSGKSTLLKAIAKNQELTEGSIKYSFNKKIAYMPQEVVLSSTKPVIDEIINSLEIFDETETEKIRAEIKKMLMGLGFSIEQLNQDVDNLSVGWKMRVLLAKLLIQKADFYLFDEPTNHLDIIAKEWFLNFLKNSKFGFLLVCHEKYFLDQACTQIFELENAKGASYKGNYSSYIGQKEKKEEALKIAYAQQQKEITRKQKTIDRFKAKASKSSMAKSMEKALSKIDRIELPNEIKKVKFQLPETQPPGRVVLKLNNVKHNFETKNIFKNVSFTVERKEKVAIVAANGVGKTTLLNLIMKKLVLQAGSIDIGYNVISAFFEQDQLKALDPEKTIMQVVKDSTTDVSDLMIRNMLGCFLFIKDIIHKKTKVLSGGERNRLSMAKVLLQKANFLILDEPTNHLDIPSKEILLDALKQYDGTILFVSHDQDFINKLASHIVELTPDGAHKYMGNYEDYLTQKSFIEQDKKNKEDKSSNKLTEKKSNNVDKNRELKRLEQQIEKIEKLMDILSGELLSYEYGTEQFDQKYSQIKDLQIKHKNLLSSWEEIF